MAITYADKDKTAAVGQPQRTWRDVDANEVKSVVNTIEQTSDAAQSDATQAISDAAAAQGDIDTHAADTSNPHSVTAEQVGFIFQETPTGSINGSNNIFTLSQDSILGSEHVFLNGLLQEVLIDYTISTNIITYLSAPETGDKLKVTYCHA